jgi:hypothetical protein
MPDAAPTWQPPAKRDAKSVAPHLKLKLSLNRLRRSYADVRAAQAHIFQLAPTSKSNTTEWTEAREAERKAVIRTRHAWTVARKDYNATAEHIRRGMYALGAPYDEAHGLVITAGVLFERLTRENF